MEDPVCTYLPTTLGVKFDMRFMAQDFFGEMNISMDDHMALNLKPTVYIDTVKPLVNFLTMSTEFDKTFSLITKIAFEFF